MTDWKTEQDRRAAADTAAQHKGGLWGDKYVRGGHVVFRTPSGSVSAAGRAQAEGKGETMPGGSFPIRNEADLKDAKQSLGRANNPGAVRRWINKRARDLGKPPLGG